MLELEENTVAAPLTVADDLLARWQAGFDEMFALVAGHFAQAQSRRRARAYVLGLLSGAERKNSWTLAEQAGELTPGGMQRLLNHYRWDADAVRDDLRGYVLDHLDDPTGWSPTRPVSSKKAGNPLVSSANIPVPLAESRTVNSACF